MVRSTGLACLKVRNRSFFNGCTLSTLEIMLLHRPPTRVPELDKANLQSRNVSSDEVAICYPCRRPSQTHALDGLFVNITRIILEWTSSLFMNKVCLSVFPRLHWVDDAQDVSPPTTSTTASPSWRPAPAARPAPWPPRATPRRAGRSPLLLRLRL